MTELLAFCGALYYGGAMVIMAYQLKRMLSEQYPFFVAVPAAFVAGIFWPGAIALMFTEK
jgi:hypothetical protein